MRAHFAWVFLLGTAVPLLRLKRGNEWTHNVVSLLMNSSMIRKIYAAGNYSKPIGYYVNNSSEYRPVFEASLKATQTNNKTRSDKEGYVFFLLCWVGNISTQLKNKSTIDCSSHSMQIIILKYSNYGKFKFAYNRMRRKNAILYFFVVVVRKEFIEIQSLINIHTQCSWNVNNMSSQDS